MFQSMPVFIAILFLASAAGVALAAPITESPPPTTTPQCATPIPANCTTEELEPLKKSECDRFYLCPRTDWAKMPPGYVLDKRPYATPPSYKNYLNGVIDASEAYRVLFRTTDSHKRAAWALTTVIFPSSDPKALVSYQYHQDNHIFDESPSYQLARRSKDSETQLGMVVAHLLGEGYIVNVPDYEGIKAAFGSGHVAGYTTLDSVRAAIGLGKVLVPQKNLDKLKYGMYGYSGGSLPTAWAAELQPKYAPDLRFTFAAFGGMYPNLTATLDWLSDAGPNGGAGQGRANNIRSGIIGLAREHPELQSEMNTNGQPWVQYVESKSDDDTYKLMQDLLHGSHKNVTKVLTQDAVLGLYDRYPTMPIFMHRHQHDGLDQNSSQRLFEFYSRYTQVYYHINNLNNQPGEDKKDGYHVEEGKIGAMVILCKMRKLFNGGHLPDGHYGPNNSLNETGAWDEIDAAVKAVTCTNSSKWDE